MITLGLVLLMAQERRMVLAELESIEIQAAAVTEQVTTLDERKAVMEAERARNAEVLARAETELTARRAETKRRVHALYRLKRRGLARLLFDAESPFELRRRVRYLWAVVRADDEATRAYAASMNERRAVAAKLEADAAALASVQVELQTRIAELEQERGRRRTLLQDVQARPPLAAQLVQERTEAAVQLSSDLARSAPPTTEVANFRAEKGRFQAPVAGRVVRPFGPYTDPASGISANNLGIDYAAEIGAPIRVVADGVVARSGYVRGYGQVVTVQHGAYATLYAHANGLRVSQGQVVQKGAVVGHVGNSGLAEDTGGRLHFEIRYNNTPQDPAEWLAR